MNITAALNRVKNDFCLMQAPGRSISECPTGARSGAIIRKLGCLLFRHLYFAEYFNPDASAGDPDTDDTHT